MEEGLRYPKDEFHSEHRQVVENGGFGGENPQRFTQFKYTFPGLKETGESIKYDLRTAFVLENASIRNDLDSIWYDPVVKGIGTPDDRQQASPSAGLKEAADFILGQIGLGSAQSLGETALNRYYFHVANSIRHKIDITKDKVQYGTIYADTLVLRNLKDLRRNGFPPKGFKMPEHASAVVLQKIQANLSRAQIQRVLRSATNVPVKYDQTPRVVLRVNHPHSIYDNLGSPRASLHSVFRSSHQEERIHTQSMEIPLEPVRRRIADRE